MAKFTQKAIIMSLLKLLETKSLDKITVKDICEMCEINRNTFYYYFSDIYQVLEALFKYETEQVLKGKKEDISFYKEYLNRYHLALENKRAVCHIYDSKSRELIVNYFESITEDFVGKYVRKEAEGTRLTERDEKYIVSFYCNAIVGNTMRWIKEGLSENKDDLIYRLSVSFKATIQVMIQSCIDEQNKKTDIFK